MTLNAAMAKASAEIDRLLEQRWDALWHQLLADGIDPDSSWILEEQQKLDRQWRAETLAEIRTALVRAPAVRETIH